LVRNSILVLYLAGGVEGLLHGLSAAAALPLS
jgi:hypothetical protein